MELLCCQGWAQPEGGGTTAAHFCVGIFCRLMSDQLTPDLDVPVDVQIHTADTAEIWAGLNIISEYRNLLSRLQDKDISDAPFLLPFQLLKERLVLQRNVFKVVMVYVDKLQLFQLEIKHFNSLPCLLKRKWLHLQGKASKRSC